MLSWDENLSNEKLQGFKDSDAFMKKHTRLIEGSLSEFELERFLEVLDLYQENPQMLDSHLETMVSPVVQCLKANFTAEYFLEHQSLFRFLYRLCKTRGYKAIQRYFTHAVEDISPLISVIMDMGTENTGCWEIRYILLLWLSLVAMIPIDLERIENSNEFQKLAKKYKFKGGLRQIMIGIGTTFLSSPGVEFEAASLLCTRIISRIDSVNHTNGFVVTLLQTLQNSTDAFITRGALNCLCTIYKFADHATLQTITIILSPLLDSLQRPEIEQNMLLQKYYVKLCQRMGQSMLKGKKSTTNFNTADINQEILPDIIEDILGLLIENLAFKDTIVRWSAAKGIGRIVSRLQPSFSDQVISQILELMSEDVIFGEGGKVDLSICSDKTWHGTVSAFSELARHKLFVPKRLADIIPWMLRALFFEIDKGTYALGSNVRDAACYFFWSVARSYTAQELEPFANDIACALVAVSLLDREVGVRRAASAAFQENAGRHMNFPNRLEIIQLTDYFAVGTLITCYTDVLMQVCEFKHYRNVCLSKLRARITHWDKQIRELAAKALGLLATQYPAEVVEILDYAVKNH